MVITALFVSGCISPTDPGAVASNNATLSVISLSSGQLDPTFQASIFDYRWRPGSQFGIVDVQFFVDINADGSVNSGDYHGYYGCTGMNPPSSRNVVITEGQTLMGIDISAGLKP